MGTKTEEEVAREAFKQELLHTSNWGLRRLATGPKGAGIEIADMKKADETGPEAVVELIMEKYADGWRPGGSAVNAQSSGKTRTTKAPPKEEPDAGDGDDTGEDTDTVKSDGTNPWDDDGDEGSDGLPADLDLDGDESKPDPEPPKEEKPKRQRRAPAKSAKAAAVGETSTIEEKIDKVLDTLMKMASMFSKIESTLDEIVTTNKEVKFLTIEGKEVATTALAVIFKKTPIKGFGKVKERATKVAKKACGIRDED